MTNLLIGYGRCSTTRQDLTAQRDELVRLGVALERIYLDHGASGKNRERPELEKALAACRTGDTLVVTRLDRLGRSILDLRNIAEELVGAGVKLQFGVTVYDPADPMGKMFFNVLATFAEFERDLISARTKDGLAVAKAAGKLKGSKPKLSPMQQRHLIEQHASGHYTISELARSFRISRAAVHRTLKRVQEQSPLSVSDPLGGF